MSELRESPIAERIRDTIATASLEYQNCQLAAQWADLEGEDLAAAVLRSVAEGQTGKVHALLLLLRQVSPAGLPTVAETLGEATARADAAKTSDGALLDAARDALPAEDYEALRAALAITGRTAQRLKDFSASRKAS